MASNGIANPAQRNAKLAEAQQRYQQALRVDPRHALATMNLALVFAQSSMLNEALLTVERAALFDGHHAIIPTNHALLALEADRIDEALEQARKAVAMAPKDATGNHARLALSMVLATAGLSEEALPIYNQMLDCEPTHGQASVGSCFIQTLTDATPADLLAQRKRWYDTHAYKGKKEPHDNSRSLDRKLRIGYVSGDFKTHSASMIFGNVLLNHTDAVEVYYYSALPVDEKVDPYTKWYKEKAGDRWRDISAMPDEEADRLIRRDKIDVLVDLSGHTGGGRLALFTRKPAPVQVTAWGFAHGTGCPEIDWFLADKIAVPEEERQFYAEKIFDLPCLLTMREPTEYNFKPASQPPFKRNGFVTFGTYCRYEKMSDKCITTFAEIMRRVPDAKMEFKDNAYRRPYSIRRILGLMKDVAPERLLFSISTSHSDHMLAYQQADLLLDPFPHGGGVVSLEQLYMGVPIITLYGRQPSGRNTSCVLSAIGRAGWIAKDPQDYIEKAVEWAKYPEELAKPRLTLRKELLESPAVKGYPEAVESAYRQMFGIWAKS